MLIFSLAFLSACVYSDGPADDGNGGSYIGNIEGFKVNYRPELFPVDDYYVDFASEILKSLGLVYGKGGIEANGATNDLLQNYMQSKYTELYGNLTPADPDYIDYATFEPNYQIYFVDNIRNAIYFDEDNSNYFAHNNANNDWKWTLNVANGYTSVTGTPAFARVVFGMGGIGEIDYHLTANNTFNHLTSMADRRQEKTNFYESFYVQTYQKALQVVILEILLGKTPTIFTLASPTTNTLSPNPDTILPALQTEYAKYSTYIGIDVQDKEKITEYVLQNVIGTEKFDSGTGLSDNFFTKSDYEEIFESVVWESLSDFKLKDEQGQETTSIYSTYPTTVLKDYSSNSFFISSAEGQHFSHIPSGEYQSVVLMGTELRYFSSLWFYLVADTKLNINVQYRYYDAENDTYYVSSSSKVTTIVESSFVQTKASVLEMNFLDNNNKPTLLKTKPFNNNVADGILKAPTGKKMNYQLADFYDLVPSQNGFGAISVLNKDKFKQDNSSYFELVFDVEKDPNNPDADYSFKLGMYSLWIASAQMINDYLLGKMV